MTDGVHKLGEVLRTAREAKSVDLPRVERDTKIRERYLSALERGEYRELPGAVYTKGFLRNYGAYLGLDPEYLIDLYRLETNAATVERRVAPVPPRPISVRRKGTFVVGAGAVAGTILTLVVLGLVVWIGYEFVNFARTPELRIESPAGDVAAHPDESMTVRGVTAANASVTVDGPRGNPTVTADENGRFEVVVNLVPGSNVIEITAHDPVTNRPSATVVRTVQVVTAATASPSFAAAAVVLVQPAADAILTGDVPIAGTAVALAPAPPVPPQPVAQTVDAAGAFVGSLALAPGQWDVTVSGAAGEPITRRVTVQPAAGLGGTLRLEGGESYIEVDQDGTPTASSRTIARDGETIALAAARELRVRAGNAGAVRLTVNGITIGAMGGDGEVVEWRITRTES